MNKPYINALHGNLNYLWKKNKQKKVVNTADVNRLETELIKEYEKE